MIRGFIPLPVYFLCFLFIGLRINTLYPRKLRREGTGFIFPIFSSLLLAVLGYASAKPVSSWVRGCMAFLMGFALIGAMVFVFESILSSIWRRKKIVLKRIALGTTFMLMGWGFFWGSRLPVIEKMSIEAKHFPGPGQGMKIAHLSDLHVHSNWSTQRLQRIVDQVNGLNPDLVVITGDLMGRLYMHETSRFSPILSRLMAPLGVYAVMGNNEFINSEKTFKKLIADTSIRVLRNEGVYLENGVYLAGVDDPVGADSGGGNPGPDLEAALAGRHPGDYCILLSHRPGIFRAACQKGVNLQLSGHTHGGQFPPISLVERRVHRYSAGHLKEKGAHLVVSPGAGTWDYLPLRLGTRNAMQVLQLISE